METEQIIRKALDLWNQGRLDEYLAYYDPETEYSMPGGVHGRGLKGIPEALKMQLTALPDSRVDIRQIIVQGETAIIEGISTGTNTGPINLPSGETLPPTGRKVSRGIAVVMKLRAEHIVEYREYSDRPTWMEQLGLVPAPAVGAAGPVRSPR